MIKSFFIVVSFCFFNNLVFGQENIKSIDDTIKSISILVDTNELAEYTIVASSRTNIRIENAPMKVEVLDEEEMQEESTVKPSTVLGIIGDASGVQVQQADPISGNSNIRIQGLNGKYTQILRDGLPLYEGYSGGFGIMSIPPLDLKQVELIKGSASTLYGGGAIGGLINLISKKPSDHQETAITLNQTTLKESNFNSFFSKKYNKVGYTMYAGLTNQDAVDVNKDQLSDVGQTRSFLIHPRLFFYPNSKSTLTVGYNLTNEKRLGGDMYVIDSKADSVHRFFEKNVTVRHNGELLYENNINAQSKLMLKNSLSSFDRAITTASHYFKGNQLDYFSEASWVFKRKKQTWVSGVSFSGSQFKKTEGDSVHIQNLNNQTIGFFSQLNYAFQPGTNLELGIRDDIHNRYGNFVLPRVALFHRINNQWGIRLGAGSGYKIPDALAAQIKEYDIEKILPIGDNIKAEISSGYNAEVNYKHNWDEESSLFINQAFFLTTINNPVVAQENTNGLLSFYNASKPIVSKGIDTYMKLKMFDWELYAGLTYTIAERKYLDSNQFMPVTPKFRMAYMLTREWEGKGRFCVEASYNGSQFRENGTSTPGYLFMAAMAEVKLNDHLKLILNGENLLDYRQSKVESLYDGTISNPSFKALWAPIDGRVINLCLKFSL